MINIFTIIFTALILWWLIAKELPMLFGVLVPTSALRRRRFEWLFVVVMVAALALPATAKLGVGLVANYPMEASRTLLLVGLSALLTLLALDHLQMLPSLPVAILAAMEAHRVFVLDAPMFDMSLMMSWIVAPAVAMLLSALLSALYRLTLGRSHIHLIRLSVVMRYVVIAGIALAAFAVGLNNGSLLIALGSYVATNQVVVVAVPAVMFVAAMALFSRSVGRLTDLSAERYVDLSTQTVVSVVFAVAITLLVFSTNLVGAVGLAPSPLGISTLLYGAFVGCSAVCRDADTIAAQWRPLVGVVLTPMVAILCYWLLSLLAGGPATGEEMNVTISVCVLMLVLVALFGRYVRKQQQLRDSSKRLILSQQQQLYENQKALNALEMKTILAENSSLHSTLELKRKEIVNVALSISEQKEFLEMLAEKVHRAAKSSGEEKDRLIAELEKDLSQRTSFSGEIDEFYTQAEVLHKDFSVKLTEEFPNLTTSERRLATLLRLGFSSKYIATLMNISPKSVEISRYRLRQKLGLQKGDNLINFIKSI